MQTDKGFLGFRITGINEELTQTRTKVIVISNPENGSILKFSYVFASDFVLYVHCKPCGVSPKAICFVSPGLINSPT